MKNVFILSNEEKIVPVLVQDAIRTKFSISTTKDVEVRYKNKMYNVYDAQGNYITSFEESGEEY